MPSSQKIAQTAWSGQSRGWRYLAQRATGDGLPGAFLDNELPLQQVTFTDVLSGPPQLSAVIDPSIARMIVSDGQPLLDEWGTIIHVEADGVIRGSTLLVSSQFSGPQWSLSCTGFSGYPQGMGYGDVTVFVNVDPLDVVRHIWSSFQSTQDSNLGLTVDSGTQTGQVIGQSVPTAASSTTGYQLDWWTSTDLGQIIDTLAQTTPFDYHERHQWNADKTAVEHYLDFGYPLIGTRREDLRFVLGENIQVMPQVDRSGSDYANHVQILGAGSGSASIRKEARASNGRLRRMVTITDSSIFDPGVAQAVARAELQLRSGVTTLSQVVVRDHPHAPMGSFSVGDQIRIGAETDWVSLDLWFRIISIKYTPDNPDLATLDLVRSDVAI